MQQVPDMSKEEISPFIDTIGLTGKVAACAPESRDGITVDNYFDRDLSEPWLVLSPQRYCCLLSRLEV